MSHRAADIITQVPSRADVRRINGVGGDNLNGITESLRGRGDIDWIHVRHEEVAFSDEIKGFAWWGLRAVLNGRGNEIIDLVESGNVAKSLIR
jgi:hypothetical protein